MDFDPFGAGMSVVSAYGLAGVFAFALAERVVLVIPYYGRTS